VLQENSLAALIAGAQQCDGVEFDVRFSADGVAVIVHDETLERLFGVPRRVGELSATKLAEIGVPTLTDVLAAMPATTLIDLELKEQPADTLFAALVAARGSEAEGVVVSSFYPRVLRTVEERAPSLARWLNAETAADADQATALGCVGVSVAMELLSDASISRWRDAGLEVAAWTLRGVQGAEWASDLRLTALCVEGEGVTAARAATR
jgi:myo-inositol-1(or 4)-monophosphatase/deoxyribonuclease-2